MNGYAAFLKKELTENMKNYRFPILFAVFLIFGLTSPFLARFMPDILSAMAPDMQTVPFDLKECGFDLRCCFCIGIFPASHDFCCDDWDGPLGRNPAL